MSQQCCVDFMAVLCECCTNVAFWPKSKCCHNVVTMLADNGQHWENVLQATLCKYCTNVVFQPKSQCCHNVVTMLAYIGQHWDNVQARFCEYCTNVVFQPKSQLCLQRCVDVKTTLCECCANIVFQPKSQSCHNVGQQWPVLRQCSGCSCCVNVVPMLYLDKIPTLPEHYSIIIFVHWNELTRSFKITFLKWEIKLLIFGVFLQCCSDVVETFKMMSFLNIATMLHDRWYFHQPTLFIQHSGNVVTSLWQYWHFMALGGYERLGTYNFVKISWRDE